MKRFVLVLIVLAAGGFVWLEIAGRKGRSSGPAVKTTREARVAAQSSVAKRTHVARPSEASKAEVLRGLTSDEFKRRFSLGPIEEMDCWSEMGEVRRDFMEQKGANAKVIAFDGKVLKVFIPALSVPKEQLELTVLTHLRKAIGDEKAGMIWGDSIGKQTVLNRGWDDMLVCNVTYTFTKLRDENDPARNGIQGNAAFDLEVVFDPGDSGAVGYPHYDQIVVHEFSYASAGVYDFGWNAMAKAPQGYFRSEPILGVASRSPPGVVVIEDLDKNSIEVRNRRYSGSKETHQFDNSASGEVNKSGAN